jgi:hypothetical protein
MNFSRREVTQSLAVLIAAAGFEDVLPEFPEGVEPILVPPFDPAPGAFCRAKFSHWHVQPGKRYLVRDSNSARAIATTMPWWKQCSRRSSPN